LDSTLRSRGNKKLWKPKQDKCKNSKVTMLEILFAPKKKKKEKEEEEEITALFPTLQKKKRTKLKRNPTIYIELNFFTETTERRRSLMIFIFVFCFSFWLSPHLL
jgi:hypothetical protein